MTASDQADDAVSTREGWPRTEPRDAGRAAACGTSRLPPRLRRGLVAWLIAVMTGAALTWGAAEMSTTGAPERAVGGAKHPQRFKRGCVTEAPAPGQQTGVPVDPACAASFF